MSRGHLARPYHAGYLILLSVLAQNSCSGHIILCFPTGQTLASGMSKYYWLYTGALAKPCCIGQPIFLLSLANTRYLGLTILLYPTGRALASEVENITTVPGSVGQALPCRVSDIVICTGHNQLPEAYNIAFSDRLNPSNIIHATRGCRPGPTMWCAKYSYPVDDNIFPDWPNHGV
jgi:hypothetical protein